MTNKALDHLLIDEKLFSLNRKPFLSHSFQGDFSEIEPIRLTGPLDSMFGIAITNLGDLNLDGYEGEDHRFFSGTQQDIDIENIVSD